MGCEVERHPMPTFSYSVGLTQLLCEVFIYNYGLLHPFLKEALAAHALCILLAVPAMLPTLISMPLLTLEKVCSTLVSVAYLQGYM